jgi:hypothetical protein
LTTSLDVIHSILLPWILLRSDVSPGKSVLLNIYFNSTGLLSGQCSELCGNLHGFMAYSILVIDLLFTPQLILVANTILLVASSAAAILIHYTVELYMYIFLELAGFAFILNQFGEVASPVCSSSILNSSTILLAVQIHASHLILGVICFFTIILLDIFTLNPCMLILLATNY